MKILAELLADVIPTKLSQAIAVLTLPLIPLAYNFPSILPPTWLPNSPEQIFLIRLLLSALVAWLGSFVVLVLVLIYAKQLNAKLIAKAATDKIDITTPLEELQEQILFLVAQQETSTELVAKSMEISELSATFHLTELKNAKLVQGIQYVVSGWLPNPPYQWTIAQPGRAYLKTHGLLK